MSKKTLIFSLILLASLGLIVSGCVKRSQPPVNTNQPVNANQNTNTPTSTATSTNSGQAQEIDTSNWKTYRNKEYGFEFKYPEGWEFSSSGTTFSVYSPEWREGLPEGGAGLNITVEETTLNEFIAEYNQSDIFDGVPLAKIIAQENYSIGDTAATKLTGSTAIGIDTNFLFINRNNKSYIISFHDFDRYHKKIISTFEFID